MSNRFRLNDEHGNECDQFATLDGVCAALARSFRGAESVADLNNLLSMEVVEVVEPSERERRGRAISRALELGWSAEIVDGEILLRKPGMGLAIFDDPANAERFLLGFEAGRRDAELAAERDCTCDERSWRGPEHDSACDFAGESRT